MPIPASTIPVNGSGQLLLPKKYQNGIATITGFTTDKQILIPIGADLSPGYNAIGTFYIISNDGDSTLQPTLTVSRAKTLPFIFASTGETVYDIPLEFGETLIVAMEDAGQERATAIKLGENAVLYVLPPATDITLGGVKVGSGVSVTPDGAISVAVYELPAATALVLGGVKVGSGINLAGDGTISVTPYTLPIATDTTLGGVKGGSNIEIDVDGMIYALNASASVLGMVRVGTGLQIDGAGILSVSPATNQFVTNTTISPPANTTVQIAQITLPAGKWIITSSQLSVATAGVTTNTGIVVKVSTSPTDITDDGFTMSAGIRAAGRFGGNVPTRIFDLATPTTVYLNYQCTDALTSTVYAQMTAIKQN